MSSDEKVAMRAVQEVAEIEAAIALAKSEKARLVKEAMGPEVWAAVTAVELELDAQIKTAEEKLAEAKKTAVTYVTEAGRTFTVDNLQAVYVSGRRGAWDDDRVTQLIAELGGCWLVSALELAGQEKFADALSGYLADFADALLKARKPDGQPSVSFKFKKEKA